MKNREEKCVCVCVCIYILLFRSKSTVKVKVNTKKFKLNAKKINTQVKVNIQAKVNAGVALLTWQLGLTWQRQREARRVARMEAYGQHGRIFRRHVRAPESSDGLDSGGVE